jgi:hypothetical protein
MSPLPRWQNLFCFVIQTRADAALKDWLKTHAVACRDFDQNQL